MIAFVGSLAFHILLFVFFAYFKPSGDASNRDIPMEIVFTEANSKNILVQAPDNPADENLKPEKEVKFKSNATRRTELETFARSKPTPIQAPVDSGGQRGQAKKANQQKETVTEFGTYKVEDDREILQLPGYGSSTSRPMIPSYVQQQMPPGVRLGNITALNTDQYRFYSFNQRLLQRFIPLWGDRVRSALYQWIKENNAPAVSKTWVTNVEVILNEKGEILEVQPFRLSGLWSIDEASINSFKDIKNVPNPPKEMVDENGYIHLQYQTEVLWIPQPNIRFQSDN